MSEGPGEVGSVGEEAAKLLGALGEWARETGQHVDSHIDTGAPECTWCPVCRTVHVIREASPEVRAHLTTAAASLMQAAAGILAAAGQAPGTKRPEGVERIDLDDASDDPGAWPSDPEEPS